VLSKRIFILSQQKDWNFLGEGWGVKVLQDQRNVWSLIRNFQRGGEVLKKFLLWERYRYFLESQ